MPNAPSVPFVSYTEHRPECFGRYLQRVGFELSVIDPEEAVWTVLCLERPTHCATGTFRQLWRWWREQVRMHLENSAALDIFDSALNEADDFERCEIEAWACDQSLRLTHCDVCNRLDILLMSRVRLPPRWWNSSKVPPGCFLVPDELGRIRHLVLARIVESGRRLLAEELPQAHHATTTARL